MLRVEGNISMNELFALLILLILYYFMILFNFFMILFPLYIFEGNVSMNDPPAEVIALGAQGVVEYFKETLPSKI